MAYNSAYTGPQVDEAVGAVREKESTWDSKQDALSGTEDQLVGFNQAGKAVPVVKPTYTASEVGAIPTTEKGVASGVATLGTDGKLTAAQKPAYTASEVGARPSTWTPTASDVGAVPTSRTVNGKALSSDISLTAGDVGARANSWTPSASEVGAVPSGNLLTFGAQSVATSAWAADTTYDGYGYRASVALSGVTADYIPDVAFSVTDATSGNLAPVADTYAGGIYIYAKETPTAAVSIASVVCVKGG